jgi:para-nitrobenzyl esterase
MRFYSIPLFITSIIIFSSCRNSKTAESLCENQSEITTSLQATTANTEYGKVAGYIENGIYIYKGIPYAEAERFMPPTKVTKWDGVRSSRSYGPTSPQGKRMGWYSDEQAFAFDWNDGYQDEDCLRLNIWTPGINGNQKRPVMVWLHGGGYSAGSGHELPSYDGKNLSRKGDIVVVSLNHRLNVLGFLDLSAYGEKYKESGNVGILDIVAALEWINKNISSFGGDPSNVTIFGQSGGGGKVSTLLATPSAEGLFHKAIIQSGAMLNTMESKWSRRIGTAVVRELGLNSSDIDKIQNIPYQQLLEAGEKAVAEVKVEADKEGFKTFIFGWAPTIDGNILPSKLFYPTPPEQSKNIPILVGTTLHEFCTSTYNPSIRNITQEQAIEKLKVKYGNRVNEYIEAFKKAYPNYTPKDLFDVDFIFRPSVVEFSNIMSSFSNAPVYTYLFTWESPVLDGILRSMHCLELPFVFNNVTLHGNMTGGGSEAIDLGNIMSSAWINFAKTGDPNTEGLPHWEPYNLNNESLMIFDNECELKKGHDKDLLDIVRLFPIRGL